MLQKSERLTKTDFVGLRPRIIFRGSFVDIAVIPAEKSRFACVLAKKRVKRAVDRNRIKRKIYHIIKKIKTKNTYLIIVYPKAITLSAEYKQLQEEITLGFATL